MLYGCAMICCFAGMVRQTSLMEARAIVGTCPDMCPEKERYGRESQRRLSWFELRRDFDPSVSDAVHPLDVEWKGKSSICVSL